MFLQLDPSTKVGVILFFFNSQELRMWLWEEVREVIAALAATAVLEPLSSQFGDPKWPLHVLHSHSSSSPKGQ